MELARGPLAAPAKTGGTDNGMGPAIGVHPLLRGDLGNNHLMGNHFAASSAGDITLDGSPDVVVTSFLESISGRPPQLVFHVVSR